MYDGLSIYIQAIKKAVILQPISILLHYLCKTSKLNWRLEDKAKKHTMQGMVKPVNN